MFQICSFIYIFFHKNYSLKHKVDDVFTISTRVFTGSNNTCIKKANMQDFHISFFLSVYVFLIMMPTYTFATDEQFCDSPLFLYVSSPTASAYCTAPCYTLNYVKPWSSKKVIKIESQIVIEVIVYTSQKRNCVLLWTIRCRNRLNYSFGEFGTSDPDFSLSPLSLSLSGEIDVVPLVTRQRLHCFLLSVLLNLRSSYRKE